MKELVTTIYVQIMKFAQRAVSWYRASKLKHFFSALAHPYSLRFQDIVEKINETSIRIEKLAATMRLVEGREIHVGTRKIHSKIDQSYDKLEETRLELQRTREQLEKSEAKQAATQQLVADLMRMVQGTVDLNHDDLLIDVSHRKPSNDSFGTH
jgi:hypothetical protein